MKRAKNIGTKLQVGLVIAICAMLVVAVGAYAWDASKDDQIADGVTIGGVQVGGQSAEQAESLVRTSLVKPLRNPVYVKFEGDRYRLTPKQLEVRADVEGMVDEAVQASREGGIFTRVWRYASGAEVESEVEPRIGYSKDALDGFIEGVAAKIDREPRDASVDPTPTTLNPVPEQPGATVRQDELRERVESALQAPGARTVKAPVDKIDPEVTTEQLASSYPTYLTIDRDNFKLRLFKNLKQNKTYTIAVGAVGYDTPSGEYNIQNKAVDPVWNVPDSDWTGDLAGQSIPPGPNNPLKARWMGIYDGAGIHGTDDTGSLGTAASHGCIRMGIPDVVELFDKVEVGDPVYIQ